jgi:hypothetical protein
LDTNDVADDQRGLTRTLESEGIAALDTAPPLEGPDSIADVLRRRQPRDTGTGSDGEMAHDQ